MKKIAIFTLLLINYFTNAQYLYDTTKYVKYYGKTLWSVYQNYYNSSIVISQTYNKDPSISTGLNINAESLKEFGVSYANQKQYIAINIFGVLNTEPSRKPKPRYANAVACFSDKNYLYEMGFNWFTGYYDKNSKNFIPKFNDSIPYYNYNKFRTLNTFINYVHFNNYKKFSYSAAYRGTARQKKSAFTTLYFVGANYNRAESDSAIIPFYVRDSYDKFSNLNRVFNSYVSSGVGMSGTLVLFKSFFINTTVMAGPALQFQQYASNNRSGFNNRLNILLVGDARFAVGISLKHFVISSSTLVNFKYYTLQKVSVSSSFLSSSFSIGYRFNQKKSKYYN